MNGPRRGDVWWGEAPDEKGRPYLVLTRDDAIPVLRTVLVAPVTHTIRGIATEVRLGTDDGMPEECIASADNILTFPKAMLVRRMATIPVHRLLEVCHAVRAATDC